MATFLAIVNPLIDFTDFCLKAYEEGLHRCTGRTYEPLDKVDKDTAVWHAHGKLSLKVRSFLAKAPIFDFYSDVAQCVALVPDDLDAAAWTTTWTPASRPTRQHQALFSLF